MKSELNKSAIEILKKWGFERSVDKAAWVSTLITTITLFDKDIAQLSDFNLLSMIRERRMLAQQTLAKRLFPDEEERQGKIEEEK